MTDAPYSQRMTDIQLLRARVANLTAENQNLQREIAGYNRIQQHGYIEAITDVTDRKNSAEKNSLLAAIVESTDDAIISANHKGIITSWNPAAEDLFGYTVQEAMGKHVSMLCSAEHRDEQCRFMRELEHHEGPTNYETVRIRKSGQPVDVALTVCMLRNPNGEASGISAIIRDISEPRRIHSELQENERMMATLLSNLPGYAYRCRNDADRTIDFISDGVFELTGYTVNEYFVQRTITCGEKTHPDDRDRIWNEVQSALDAKRPYECIYRILTKSDDVKWVWEKGRGIYSPDGQLLHIEGFVTDITQRRQDEKALQESEMRFDHLLSSLDEVVWSASPDSSKFLYINPAAETVYGRPIAEFHENSNLWLDVIHPDDRDDVEKSAAELFERGAWQHEYRIIRPDGGIRWVSDRTHVVYDDAGLPSSKGGIATDITARKRAEELLHDREERYRHLVEMHPDAIAIHREGRYLYFNPAGAKLLAASKPEQLIGMSVLSIVHPDFRASVKQRIEAVQKSNEILRFDHEKLIRLDGKVIDVEITGRQVIFDGQPAVQITMRDITHRRQVEKQLAEQEAQLAHVARLSTMGEMVGGIAHEINQPLAAISNYAGACGNLIMARHNGWADNVLGFTRQISQQAVCCGDIIRRLGNFVKKNEGVPSVQEINDLVVESVNLVASAVGKRAMAVQLELHEPSPRVAVDGIQIQQVIVNLLRNAYEAMHESGAGARHVTIRSRMTEGCVEVSVKDTGPGLPDDDIGNLFDAFFTTKKSGMGIGLAISRSIIDSYGGRLSAESDPKIGAIFCFTLPVVSDIEAHVS